MTTSSLKSRTFIAGLAVFGMSAFLGTAAVQAAEGGAAHGAASPGWSFGGVRGHFDRAQLQRGFQVYKEVCSACHSIKRLSFRNLVEKGGPQFPEEGVKSLAATYKITDGPNDQGKMFKRPGRLSDRIPSPFDNEQQARSANNGALPPDFSLIAKARSGEHDTPFYRVPDRMLWDIFLSGGYQEAGSDYIYSLLSGYQEAPKEMKMSDGMYYNQIYPGHQIAMPAPLSDGIVKYTDGTPGTVANYARDVTAFLSWAADPKLEERKKMGVMVMLYLGVLSILLYFAKRHVWAGEAH